MADTDNPRVEQLRSTIARIESQLARFAEHVAGLEQARDALAVQLDAELAAAEPEPPPEEPEPEPPAEPEPEG